MRLYHFHGKDSGPESVKAQFVRRHFGEAIVPALPNDFLERRAILDDLVAPGACLTGSSLGGLSALDYAIRHPGAVSGLVLLAPAVGVFDESTLDPEAIEFMAYLVVPAGIPTHLIAGIHDAVIPLAAIEDLVRRSPAADIAFFRMEDDHGLQLPTSLQRFLQSLQQVMKSADPG